MLEKYSIEIEKRITNNQIDSNHGLFKLIQPIERIECRQ